VNANSVPYTFTTEGVSITIKKGLFTINSDGTCIRNITLASPNKPEISNDVKATYTLAGSTLTMNWERAGIMTGTVTGNTFTMDDRGMVFVFQKGQGALYHKEVNDNVNTVNGKALIMVLDEVQRFDKFSIIRVKYASGAAAPSVMFTYRCNYEMAKLRKADYFILLKQWTDEKGDSMYKIGFSSDPKVDPSHYFGDAIDHQRILIKDLYWQQREIHLPVPTRYSDLADLYGESGHGFFPSHRSVCFYYHRQYSPRLGSIRRRCTTGRKYLFLTSIRQPGKIQLPLFAVGQG